jgi:hypothetical protein
MKPGDKFKCKCVCSLEEDKQKMNVKADCIKNDNKVVTKMRLQFSWSKYYD